MKRLLAMFTALFTSLFSGLNYQVSDYNKPYGPDVYYKVDEAQAPDYRTLYDRNFIAESNTVGCKTSNYSVGATKVTYTEGFTPKHSGYWLVSRSSAEVNTDLQLPAITIEALESYIMCPYDATLLSSSVTNDGHSMLLQIDLEGVSYKLLLENMDRWYCCMSRTNPLMYNEGGNSQEVWQHTSPEQQGHKFKAGDVLGRSSSDAENKTVARLTELESGNNITFFEMYTQTKIP